MGYSGGTTRSPTYSSIGDHSETIEIDFDPSVISYADLLAVFWDAHTPTGMEGSRQYRSAIFVHDEAQRVAAAASLRAEEESLSEQVTTSIEACGGFTRAEDYHQKYYLRGVSELEEDLTAMYPDADDFTDSTAAARINGYVGGHGTLEDLEEDLPRLGLSDRGARALRDRVDR